MKKIVSFSGGKDSTAMLLRLLEENYQVDDIVFFDTGWEFPEILEHVQKVQEKTQTIERYLRKKHDNQYETYIGFAADEIKRTGCGNACAGEEKNGKNDYTP
jgi:3'-phosphoadenosine 5'-phosphosulfate sulfotransferase (PAPS reductase)/FAD synthetase